jgi:hypothetical protein
MEILAGERAMVRAVDDADAHREHGAGVGLVGSGVTESTCKTVIGHRAKGAGQRWREAGLRGVLTLRALHQSDRLPRFWSHLATGYTANVEAA